MANINKHDGGRKSIQWYNGDRRRKTISIGKATMKQAEGIATHIERLETARTTKQTVERDTARWVGEIGDSLHAKLAGHELVEPRTPTDEPEITRPTIKTVHDEMAAKRTDAKERTRTNWGQAYASLAEYFGADKVLAEITPADAEDWDHWLRGVKKLKTTTHRKRVQIAKQIAKWAMRRGYCDTNPFDALKSASVASDRRHFVTREERDAVMAACPNAQWRALFSLARDGALRIVSEIVGLRWGDIDFDPNRRTMRVMSPKTAHHAGHGERVVPLFPGLYEALLDAQYEAPEGTEYVITLPEVRQTTTANLHKKMKAIIKRAGVDPWPRLWQNCRATRQTELEIEFPRADVCAWVGNSEAIAAKYYVQATAETFRRAAGITDDSSALPPALPNAGESHGSEANGDEANAGCNEKTPATDSDERLLVLPTGFEPVSPG